MKKYVVICETMNRASSLCKCTLHCLGSLIRVVRRYPMLYIETVDNTRLYFTSEYLWFRGGQRLGRHDWKPIHGYKFETMLDAWVAGKENNLC